MLRPCAISTRCICMRHIRHLSSAGTETEYSERARRIRREVFVFQQLRRLIIPGFLAYGLFLLRPHEGHFLRYLAERRHHEADFNRLFPPIASAPSPVAKADGPAPSESLFSLSWRRGAAGGGAAEKEEEEEDAARLSRRRMLFSRERVYSSDDGGEVFRPIGAEARASQLEAQHEAPPMHLVSEQLQNIMRESKAYTAEQTGCGSSGTAPPSVRLEFRDWLWFATGSVVFTERSGLAERRLRFVGVCGMIWREM